MTPTRWAAATFVLICLAVYGRPPDYYNAVIFPVAVLLGILTLAAALGRRPSDRVALRLLSFGAFLIGGLPLLAMGLEAVGLDLEFASGISTAKRCLEVSTRTAILWIPLAIASVLPIWFQKNRAAAHQPLSLATLSLRFVSCVMAPWTLLAMGSEKGGGGLGISVLAPILLVAWYAGRLAWEPPGETRATIFRRYARLFAVVATITLAFTIAQTTGSLKYDHTYDTYVRNPNWRLLSFSEMGIPFTVLALLYFAMSVWLFKLSAGQPHADRPA